MVLLTDMKVLFICRANVGRSQAAMELYNKAGGISDSAGTKVDMPEEKLSERAGADTIVAVMHDYGVDMSANVRVQLTESMSLNYDTLIVMAEPDNIPDWLRKDPKTEIWSIRDPKGEDFATTKAIVEQIKQKVATLK